MAIADTSLAAYREHKLRGTFTRTQATLIAWLHKNGEGRSFTREQLALLTGIKESTICGRVNELLYEFDPPYLIELPVVNGKHPIKLVDNYTYTELFRHETEINMLVRMRSDTERAEYLVGIEKKRGKDAAQRLRQDVWDEIKIKRAA